MRYFVLAMVIGELLLFGGSGRAVFGEIQAVNKRLISVEDNLRVAEWSYQTTTAEGDTVRIIKSVLHGGKQEGVDVVTIDNGRMQIVVVPTRGMSILGVTMGKIRLGWDSPVREVVHPALINLQEREGLGWLDGFNEWLVRCGLEFAGHPGRDSFRDNTGAEAEQTLTLHGKIGNIPASEVQVSIDPNPPHRIRLSGRVDERGFYGAALELATEVSTLPGSNALEISDAVTNKGAEPQEYEVIYHANFGSPLLEAGASLAIPLRRLQPMNDTAQKALGTFAGIMVPPPGFARISAPTPGKKEEVFLIEPLTDPKGRTTVLLQNADKTLGCSVNYSVDKLPFLTIWKNLAPVRSGYVIGIEPGTNYPFNRSVERAAGRLKKLKPDETAAFALEYVLHADSASVAKAAEAIATLNEGYQPTIVPSPPKLSE